MNTNSKKRPKDRDLFANLVKAHKANAVIVTANAARLNHPGSPVWDAGENVAPILAMLTLSVVFIFAINLIVGLALMVLSVFLYLIFIRPWILQRVSRRAIDAATMNLHNWDLLWKKGGLAVALIGTKKSRVTFPDGDWRDFVARHLPQVNVDGTEIYNAFKRAEDDDADVRSLDDLNM